MSKTKVAPTRFVPTSRPVLSPTKEPTLSKVTQNLATCQIHHDLVEVYPLASGEVAVSLNQVCPLLALSPEREVARLDAAPWAKLVRVLGRALLPRPQVPQWAASARVSRRYADKLAVWQTEASELLAAFCRKPTRAITIASELVRLNDHGREVAVPGSRQDVDIEDFAAAVARHMVALELERRLERVTRAARVEATELRGGGQ